MALKVGTTTASAAAPCQTSGLQGSSGPISGGATGRRGVFLAKNGPQKVGNGLVSAWLELGVDCPIFAPPYMGHKALQQKINGKIEEKDCTIECKIGIQIIRGPYLVGAAGATEGKSQKESS